MTKQQVISELGNPDGFQRNGDYEALLYTNRLISGWSWDRTDTIILQNGKVVQYRASPPKRAKYAYSRSIEVASLYLRIYNRNHNMQLVQTQKLRRTDLRYA